DFGTSMSLLLIAAVMVFAAGLNYRYVAGALLCALPALYLAVMGSAYRRRGTLGFLKPWDDPPGDGFLIIQSLIAGGTGGVVGQGPDERRSKAVLSAGAAHRLHLFGDRRGARADWGERGGDLLLRDDLARHAHRAAGARFVRRLSRARPDDDGRGAGVCQHQR